MKKTILLAFFTSVLFSVIYGQALSKKENKLFHDTSIPSMSRSVLIYTLTTLTDPYNNLTGATSVNNGEIWDDPEYVVPVSFPFSLLGTEITSIQLAGAGSLFASATEDPDISVNVFPFEADLIDRGDLEEIESLSPISY